MTPCWASSSPSPSFLSIQAKQPHTLTHSLHWENNISIPMATLITWRRRHTSYLYSSILFSLLFLPQRILIWGVKIQLLHTKLALSLVRFGTCWENKSRGKLCHSSFWSRVNNKCLWDSERKKKNEMENCNGPKCQTRLWRNWQWVTEEHTHKKKQQTQRNANTMYDAILTARRLGSDWALGENARSAKLPWRSLAQQTPSPGRYAVALCTALRAWRPFK